MKYIPLPHINKEGSQRDLKNFTSNYQPFKIPASSQEKAKTDSLNGEAEEEKEKQRIAVESYNKIKQDK